MGLTCWRCLGLPTATLGGDLLLRPPRAYGGAECGSRAAVRFVLDCHEVVSRRAGGLGAGGVENNLRCIKRFPPFGQSQEKSESFKS